MTIRQRLSFSNILMLVIPIILCMIFINSMMWNATRYLEEGAFFSNKQLHKLEAELEEALYNWQGSYEELLAFIKEAEANLPASADIAIYDADNVLRYPAVFANELAESGLHLQLFHNQTITVEPSVFHIRGAGDYTIVIAGGNPVLSGLPEFRDYFMRTGFMLFAFVIAGICLTNAVLTRIMVKHIMNPIHTLSDGVHQLRDGNLDYRIHYPIQNEFQTVCADFDEMAARLSAMVNERQLDEEKRKELIAGISHDLRTPLTSIKAYVEGLEKGVAATPDVQARYMETIKNKVLSMERIINQLFQYTKLDMDSFPFNWQTVDAGRIVSEFVEQYEDEYEKKGLVLVWPGCQSRASIRADVDLLSNVFINIFDNSVRYKTAPRGHLWIGCEAVGDTVVFQLRDDGPGMKPEGLHKLFDVFYRGDAARGSEGSGLGLAISAKHINRMGGRITAENAEGGGLAIRIELPRGKEVACEKDIDY